MLHMINKDMHIRFWSGIYIYSGATCAAKICIKSSYPFYQFSIYAGYSNPSRRPKVKCQAAKIMVRVRVGVRDPALPDSKKEAGPQVPAGRQRRERPRRRRRRSWCVIKADDDYTHLHAFFVCLPPSSSCPPFEVNRKPAWAEPLFKSLCQLTTRRRRRCCCCCCCCIPCNTVPAAAAATALAARCMHYYYAHAHSWGI